MFSPIQYELVASMQRQERLREAEKDRLIHSLAVSSHRRSYVVSLFKWLDARITRVRCAVFPFNASPICTP